jgi:hypothetical protein
MELKEAMALTPYGWSVDKWIGLDDYPLFDESHRAELNQKITREYYNSEIGMETISMFALAVRRKLHKEMPLLNLMYESAAQKFDALITVDIATTANGSGQTTAVANSVNSNGSTSKSTSLTVASDFPQSALSDRGAYASSSQDGDGTSDVTASARADDTSSNTTASNDISATKGFQGNAAELILAKRSTFINIDARVVDILSDCFMQVWSDGSQHLMKNGY